MLLRPPKRSDTITEQKVQFMSVKRRTCLKGRQAFSKQDKLKILKEVKEYDEKITHKQLYAISDKLYENKERIDQFIYNRVTDLFDLKDKLVIFDISNTYFETGKRHSKIAQYGRSKEKRNDCPIVVFTGVINAEGFIRHSRIYEGQTADMTTLGDMLKDLEKYAKPHIERTVVMDAGLATEDNLKLIHAKGYKYVCVSRKRLEDYPVDQNDKTVTIYNKNDEQKIELSVFRPDGYRDTWMYVQSEAKRKKEQSMHKKLIQRFEENLDTIKKAIHRKGGMKSIEKVWQRIGRAKQKHNLVSAQYDIVVKQSEGIATQMSWRKKTLQVKEDKTKGIYFLRTNYQNPTEHQLWDIYNTIREVESTFRCLKTDLQIRPVHHQKDDRIKSHIYLTILAYQLVNTIRFMLKQHRITSDWKNIVRILKTHTIQTVVLPTDKKVIHMRMPSKPIQQVQQIYQATECAHTQTATKKYVVYH
jgi:transposase